MPVAARRPLTPREGYQLWAPTYGEETVVSALEDRVVRILLPELGGRRLLDAGCGIARRLRSAGSAPALAVGVDLVPQMLSAVNNGPRPKLVAGDVRRLPFIDGAFDVLWCRLVLGHLNELTAPYRELARVSGSGAALIVSDFHPRAVAAGHSRSFRNAEGAVHEIEHHVYEVTDHAEAAAAAGWRLVGSVDAPAGAEERPFYERAGRLSQFEAEAGLPLVLAISFKR